MASPLYSDSSRPRQAPRGCNLGLWYTRFFDKYSPNWQLDEDAKRSWIDSAARFGHEPKVEVATGASARRQIRLVEAVGGDLRELATSWHFATGLGLPHPVENGFAWHHTLGLPYLIATGVKGLLAAWLSLVHRDEDESVERRSEARRRHEQWCGTQERAGTLIFFDALPIKPPKLITDVMTPHMGKWYEKGDTIANIGGEPEKVPADWHSPTPVPFLAVEKATFLFGIAPRSGADWQGRDSTQEVSAALDELEAALAVLGAGAKTAVGYGRFKPGRGILAAMRDFDAVARDKKAAKQKRADALEPFDEFDPKVSDILAGGNLDGLTTVVLKALEDGEWDAKERALLAEKLRSWMIGRKEWVEDAEKHAKKAGKKKKIRNTLRVLKWLPKS